LVLQAVTRAKDNTNNGAGLVKVYIPKLTPFYPLLTPFFGAVFAAPLFHQS
jgi:hypothetical protein